MKKKVGIWLDYRKADIIAINGGEINTIEVRSNLDESKPIGGARSKQPYGPMDTVSESKHLEKRKQQLKSFYQEIMSKIKDADELFVFGPAEAKIGFNKEMDIPAFKPVILGVENADSITLNQKISKVKSFFNI